MELDRTVDVDDVAASTGDIDADEDAIVSVRQEDNFVTPCFRVEAMASLPQTLTGPTDNVVIGKVIERLGKVIAALPDNHVLIGTEIKVVDAEMVSAIAFFETI